MKAGVVGAGENENFASTELLLVDLVSGEGFTWVNEGLGLVWTRDNLDGSESNGGCWAALFFLSGLGISQATHSSSTSSLENVHN